MTEIVKGVLLANKETASHQRDYTLAINCTPDLPFYQKNIRQIRISVWDRQDNHQSKTMIAHLPDIVKEIDQVVKEAKTVLVYCAAGQSRSATVVASYLIWRNNWTVDQTVNFIKKQDPNAFFGGVTFRDALEWVFDNRDTLL